MGRWGGGVVSVCYSVVPYLFLACGFLSGGVCVCYFGSRAGQFVALPVDQRHELSLGRGAAPSLSRLIFGFTVWSGWGVRGIWLRLSGFSLLRSNAHLGAFPSLSPLLGRTECSQPKGRVTKVLLSYWERSEGAPNAHPPYPMSCLCLSVLFVCFWWCEQHQASNLVWGPFRRLRRGWSLHTLSWRD